MNKQEELRNTIEAREKFKKELDKNLAIRNHYRNFTIISFAFALLTFFKFYLWYVSLPFVLVGIFLLSKKFKYDWEVKKYEFLYLACFAAIEMINMDIDANDSDKVNEYIENLVKRAELKKSKGSDTNKK